MLNPSIVFYLNQTSLTLVLVFVSIAPPTSNPTDLALILLPRNGSPIRTDRGAIASVRDLETISSCATIDGLIGTRSREVALVPFDQHGEPRVILTHTTPVRFAELSPDREFLAFSASVTDDPQIFLATRDAHGDFANAKPVARGYGPSFSHDGRFIYFERGDEGLARFDVHSGQVEPFLPDNRRAHTVRCSRDGKWIAFSMDRAMYLYRTSDKSARRLSDGKSYDRFASFAGEEVVFYRETSDGKEQIIAMRTDGTNERVLYRGDVMLACCLPPTPTTQPK